MCGDGQLINCGFHELQSYHHLESVKLLLDYSQRKITYQFLLEPFIEMKLLNAALLLSLIFPVQSVVYSQTNQPEQLRFSDAQPKLHRLTARASDIDKRVRAHPEIGFLLESNGKPTDLQHASVDTRVAPRGKLMVWLMAHNGELFDRVNSYGIHAIRVHYANKWFSICCQEKPVGEMCRGDIRLEAATGEDFSNDVTIPQPDGMMERTLQFVKWLHRNHPQGGWDYFLTPDQNAVRWEDVIIAGSSHGSTTAARFAKHQKVGRVVMFCGPRDQFQTWQSLKSATPSNRYFGFSHTLDSGWSGDHYCRSWEMLGLHSHGEIVNVDQWNRLHHNSITPKFNNTRRLVTDFDVNGDAKRAHSSVLPGKRAFKKADAYQHESVWQYLFTHPVEETGTPTATDPSCLKQHTP